jgi:hypothetical protein
MFLTNRHIMSLAIAVCSGLMLWVLPTLVRGDNQLFAMNATLLPVLAISLMLVLSAIEFGLSVLNGSKSAQTRQMALDEDVKIKTAQVFSVCLVVILMVLFVLLLPKLGYLLTSTAFLLGLMLGTGGRRPIIIIFTAIIAVSVLYIALRYGLGLHFQIWPNLSFGNS